MFRRTHPEIIPPIETTVHMKLLIDNIAFPVSIWGGGGAFTMFKIRWKNLEISETYNRLNISAMKVAATLPRGK